MEAVQTLAVTRREMETRLVEKAWKDPVFRKDIVKDPKGMLEKHTGQKLPEQLRIFVHEEDANTLHFSIPPAPSNLNELSDEDLEKVAGGTDIVITGVTTSLVFGLGAVLAGTALAGVTAAGVAAGTAAGVLKGTGTW